MAGRKKFEKLGTNEHYSDTHNEDKNKDKTGVFEKIGKRMTAGTLDPQNVPEKQKISSKFTFEKDKRTSPAAAVKQKAEAVERPAKAPFVLMLVSACLVFFANLLFQSEITKDLSQISDLGIRVLLSLVAHVVPTVVYIMSSSERKKAYNMKSFSPSYAPLVFVSFILMVCVSALQKYYIAYTFSYSVDVIMPNQSIWLLLFTSAFLPAICEELLVHGVLQHEFSKYGGGFCGVLASGLVFALVHFDLQYFFIYLISGLILSSLTHITRSVYPAMLVHFLNNVMTVLLSDRMAYVATERIGGTLLMVLLSLLSFVFLILLLRMAQNISETRAATASGALSSKESFEDADFLTAEKGSGFKRTLFVLAQPFMLIVFALFVVGIVVL